MAASPIKQENERIKSIGGTLYGTMVRLMLVRVVRNSGMAVPPGCAAAALLSEVEGQ